MNKRYIKVALFLLSLLLYVTNKALASELFLRGDVALNAYSNIVVPSDRYFNTAIIRKVGSYGIDQKSTRPIGVIQSNDNPYVAVSRDGNSNFTGPRNARSNAAI
ncbi:fam-a protein, fragment [Plasmodium vinckei lentum]|uniref:Fam-a protein n=1 Tax=Plasmodium vinckei lentum TaxID=138297 RepID=A0A6V7RU90_PLAVN|nr:fam-a protein, fragment [Plasmodium vinckei lentum]